MYKKHNEGNNTDICYMNDIPHNAPLYVIEVGITFRI